MEHRPGQPRYFTLEEANSCLPRVREVLVQLQARASELATAQADLEAFGEQARRNGHTLGGGGRVFRNALRRAEAAAKEIRALLTALEQIGCELTDIEMGVVDFRSERDGRAVYLCWRLGEDAIRFWHELDTGFTGRQPL